MGRRLKLNFDLDHSDETENEFSKTFFSRFSNLNGYGKLQTPFGTYIGHFKNGLIVGSARFYRKDGVLFDGFWKVNQKDKNFYISNGKMTFLDGKCIYEGEFDQHFLPHGKGILLFSHKNSKGAIVQKKYTGIWKNDVSFNVKFRLNGKAEFKVGKTEIRTYEGDISILNDSNLSVILNGQGRETVLDKLERKGMFYEGKLHGQGYTITDGKKIEGKFIHNKPHGRIVAWDASGVKRNTLYIDGIEVRKPTARPFLTFDQLTQEKIWNVNESKTIPEVFFNLERYNSLYGKLNGIGLFDTPQSSILGHYVDGKLQGSTLRYFEGDSNWHLGTYAKDNFVFGINYPSNGFKTVYGLQGFGKNQKSRINHQGGALPMMFTEDIEEDGLSEETDDLNVVRALTENLLLVGFNRKEIMRMMTIITPIAIDSWRARSTSWFQTDALTFGGVNSLYPNKLISLDEWSDEEGRVSPEVIADNGANIICDALQINTLQPGKDWIDSNSKLCELICTIAFYFECNQEFEIKYEEGELQGENTSLMMSVDLTSVETALKKWSDKIGATSSIPISYELISRLYGSLTMGGRNEENKTLMLNVYESYLNIEAPDGGVSQVITDAAHTVDLFKFFFGEQAGSKIMHDFSFGVFQRCTWTRGLASIFTEAPPAKFFDVRMGKAIENHGFFTQFMLRRYSELILLKNEGETDDFPIHELLLRMSDPQLMSRICEYGDDWIHGSMLLRSKNQNILKISLQELNSFSSDIFILPTNVAFMRLLLNSRCDLVCSVIVLLRFEQILAEETIIKNSGRGLKRTFKKSTNSIFDSAAKKVESLKEFQSNQAGEIEAMSKLRRLTMFMEEIFLFAQDVWTDE